VQGQKTKTATYLLVGINDKASEESWAKDDISSKAKTFAEENQLDGFYEIEGYSNEIIFGIFNKIND